jgi:hypothetical protein
MATITNPYHAAPDGEQGGPFSGEELAAMAEQGRLAGDTMVWREGMAEWVEASTVAELALLINEAAARREKKEAAEAAARKIADAEAEAARKKAEAEAEAAEAAAKKKADAEARREALRKTPSKSPLLVLLGIFLLVSTFVIDYEEELDGLGPLEIDNGMVAVFAVALIITGIILGIIRRARLRK